MKKLIAALLCFLAGPALSQTGTSKTTTQLTTEINTLWPDNTTGQITPFNARQTLLDMITSYPNANTAANANTVYSGPISGAAAAPAFRTMVGADMPTGVNGNILNAIGINHTIAPADCRTSLEMTGGVSMLTVTLPAPAGFPTDCVLRIYDASTQRAVKLVGFPPLLTPLLFPGQAVGLALMGGVWVVTDNPQHWPLTVNTTFFLDFLNGNDGNDGLAAGTGGALKTIQAAYDYMVTNLDLNLKIATWSMSNAATYTSGLNAKGMPVGTCGPDCIIFDGNGTAKVNTSGVGSAFIINNTGADHTIGFTLKNMIIETTSGSCVEADGGVIYVSAITFGDGAVGPCAGPAMYAKHMGTIIATGDVTVAAGTVGAVQFAQTEGITYAENPHTLFFTGNVTCSIGCFVADGGQIWDGGAAPGLRLTINTGGFVITGGSWVANDNSLIITNLGPTTFFPGTIRGQAFRTGITDMVGANTVGACTGVTTPGLACCGTGAAVQADSNDFAGSVTFGTTGLNSACEINLQWYYPNPPHCNITQQTQFNSSGVIPGVFTYSVINGVAPPFLSTMKFGYSPTVQPFVIQWQCIAQR